MKKWLSVAIVCAILVGCSNLKVEWAMSYKTDNLKAELEKERGK